MHVDHGPAKVGPIVVRTSANAYAVPTNQRTFSGLHLHTIVGPTVQIMDPRSTYQALVQDLQRAESRLKQADASLDRLRSLPVSAPQRDTIKAIEQSRELLFIHRERAALAVERHRAWHRLEGDGE